MLFLHHMDGIDMFSTQCMIAPQITKLEQACKIFVSIVLILPWASLSIVIIILGSNDSVNIDAAANARRGLYIGKCKASTTTEALEKPHCSKL
jgi:hypothetical protein